MRPFLRRDLLLAACAAPFVLNGAVAAAPAHAASGAKPPSGERKLIVENLTKSASTTHSEMLDLNDVLKAFSKLDGASPAESAFLAAVQARLKANDDWLAAIARSGFTGKV